MLQFEYQTTGTDSAVRALEMLGRGIRDFQPLWDKVEDDFYQMERDLWASQGNGKWQPNSGLYAERKSEHFPGRAVMELTGGLYKSMTVRGSPGQVRRMARDSMTLGTDVPYAAVHHYGSSARMWIPAPFYFWINGLPARPILDVQTKDEDRWRRLAEDFVVDVAQKAGL